MPTPYARDVSRRWALRRPLFPAASHRRGCADAWHELGLQRFSTLTQINKDTVRRLLPQWAYALGGARGQGFRPLVRDQVIYFTPQRHDGRRRADRAAALERHDRVPARDYAARLLQQSGELQALAATAGLQWAAPETPEIAPRLATAPLRGE